MFKSVSGSSSLKVSTFVAVGLLAAACQSGDGLDGLGIGGSQSERQQEQVPVEELRAFCPTVSLREGTASFNTYERGGDGDPARLVYQAAINDITRSCSYNGSTITVNVAVAGRIVPGPRGQTGSVTMPIRVVALRGSEVLYSELHQHRVDIADTAGATQFIFSDPNVTFVVPPDRGVRILAGYDEGPTR
jgi:hypothetical protein